MKFFMKDFFNKYDQMRSFQTQRYHVCEAI